MKSIATPMLTALLATSVQAQVSILLADRTSDRIYIATDADRNGQIGGVGELARWFDLSNVAGTPAPLNPNALGYGGGMALIGDQDSTARRWLWTRDTNGDGDALDAGESGLWCDATNPAGFSLAFPTGVAWSVEGRIALVNAGNGFGADDVFLAIQGSDSDANDAGELARWVSVNGFGTNGSFSPQEVCYDNAGTLYLRNSGATNAIFALRDSDGSGTIDQPSEMRVYFGDGNGSGITVSTGFDVSIDPARARSHYFWQTITGGIDQFYRLSDLNGDGDAMDAGEAVQVYTSSLSGFTPIDSLPLADGSVLISDNSGSVVGRLRDLDGDGLFASAGEYTLFLSSGPAAARAMALIHDVGCSIADLGGQGGVLGGDGLLNNNDFITFIDLFFARAPLADQGRQGGVAPGDGLFDNNDFIAFIDAFFAGCP